MISLLLPNRKRQFSRVYALVLYTRALEKENASVSGFLLPGKSKGNAKIRCFAFASASTDSATDQHFIFQKWDDIYDESLNLWLRTFLMNSFVLQLLVLMP